MSAKTTYKISSQHKRGNTKCQLQDICLWTLGSSHDKDGLPRWQRIHQPTQETQAIQAQSLGGEDPLEEEMEPTPVFLPGKPHGQRSLAGYSPWGCKESDTTK